MDIGCMICIPNRHFTLMIAPEASTLILSSKLHWDHAQHQTQTMTPTAGQDSEQNIHYFPKMKTELNVLPNHFMDKGLEQKQIGNSFKCVCFSSISVPVFFF